MFFLQYPSTDQYQCSVVDSSSRRHYNLSLKHTLRKRGVSVARVTVEDCLNEENNRFALVVLAARRSRQLAKGGEALIECNNRPVVTALREIAEGKVRFNEDVKAVVEGYLSEIQAIGIPTPPV